MNLKYDSWHKEVLSKFGQMLGNNMQDFHSQISKVCAELSLKGQVMFVCSSECSELFCDSLTVSSRAGAAFGGHGEHL